MKKFLILVQLLLLFSACQKSLSGYAVEEAKNRIQLEEKIRLRYPDNDNYKSLRKVAATDDLIILCDHQNPIVRCYAYDILKEKEYSRLIEIYKEHKKDQARVFYISGPCTSGNFRINEQMLAGVDPKYKFGFSGKEYQVQKDLIEEINQ